MRQTSGGFALIGEKVAVEQPDLADRLAVLAALDSEPAIALVPVGDPGVVIEPRTSVDTTLPMSAVMFTDALVPSGAAITGSAARNVLSRLDSAGSLLAAAEAIGAAERILDDARRYAGERRQFGRSIGSFQSLRHILADMYVRSASGWSAVLYAAAAFDDGADDAAQTASIAKAYVSRGAREVAHGALQVFGGIAFTAEHPAHRFLRRILVREQQFGDAAHHERALGRALARRAERPPGGGGDLAGMTISLTDPTAQRLEPIATGAEPAVVGPHLAEVLHDERWRTCEVALISGGKSNLTYRVASDAGEVVLRRPPLGHVLPTAHDMVREYRVQAALEQTPVPAPRMLSPRRTRRRARSQLLRDGTGARPHLPQPPSDWLRGYRATAGGDRARADRDAREPARDRPRRRRPRGVRPAGRLHGAPAAPLVRAVAALQDGGSARTRCAPGRARPDAPAPAVLDDRPRGLSPRQHDPSPDASRARSWRCSTGR